MRLVLLPVELRLCGRFPRDKVDARRGPEAARTEPLRGPARAGPGTARDGSGAFVVSASRVPQCRTNPCWEWSVVAPSITTGRRTAEESSGGTMTVRGVLLAMLMGALATPLGAGSASG